MQWEVRDHDQVGTAALAAKLRSRHEALAVASDLNGYYVGLVAGDVKTVFVTQHKPSYVPVRPGTSTPLRGAHSSLEYLEEDMNEDGYFMLFDGVAYVGNGVYYVPFTEDEDADEEDEKPSPRKVKTPVSRAKAKPHDDEEDDTVLPKRAKSIPVKVPGAEVLMQFLDREGHRITGVSIDNEIKLTWNGVMELTTTGVNYRQALTKLRDLVNTEAKVPNYPSSRVLAWTLANRLYVTCFTVPSGGWAVSYFPLGTNVDDVPQFTTLVHKQQMDAVREAMFRLKVPRFESKVPKDYDNEMEEF